MSKQRNQVLVAAIWAVGMAPAALLLMWIGHVDATWFGFVTAWAILLALAGIYELLQTWIARMLNRRRSAPGGSGR